MQSQKRNMADAMGRGAKHGSSKQKGLGLAGGLGVGKWGGEKKIERKKKMAGSRLFDGVAKLLPIQVGVIVPGRKKCTPPQTEHGKQRCLSMDAAMRQRSPEDEGE